MQKFNNVISPALLIVLWISASICLFWLPYNFSDGVVTVSASYDYGFNNFVGIVVLFFVCVCYLLLGWWKGASNAVGLESAISTGGVLRKDLILTGLTSILLAVFLYFISGSHGFTESVQFFHAVDRLLAGQVLYSDFDFYYGPLLGYLPAFASLGFGVKAGYFLVLAILQLAGLVQLRYLTNKLPIREVFRRPIFYTVAILTMPIHSGINLLLVRYITLACGILFISKIDSRRQALIVMSSLALSFLSYGISTEYGAICTLTLAVSGLVGFYFSRRLSDLAVGTLSLFVPIVFFFAFPGMFETVALYAKGGWNWPFVPSMALLSFFAAIFLVAYNTGENFRAIKSNIGYLSVILASLGGLPAALGRCDPGHILLNGLPVILVGFGYLTIKNLRWSRVFGSMLLLTFGLLYGVSVLQLYAPVFAGLAIKRLVTIVPSENFVKAAALIIHDPEKLARIQEKIDRAYVAKNNLQLDIPEGQDIIVPYYVNDIYDGLRERYNVRRLYFKSYDIITNSDELRVALSELARNRDAWIVIGENYTDFDEPVEYAKLINILFSTYYNRQAIHNGASLYTPIIEYINDNYAVRQKINGYLVLQPKQVTE
jgi:hypothetical protein